MSFCAIAIIYQSRIKLMKVLSHFERSISIFTSNHNKFSPTVIHSSQRCKEISDILSSHGFNYGQISYIIKSPITILNYDEEDIISNLQSWHAFDVNKKLFSALTRYNELLTLSPAYIEERKKKLMTMFTRKDINKLLLTCPKIFLDDVDILEEKVQYIVNCMGVEQNSIVKSEALQFDLDHIKYRHEFLKRTGFYKLKKKSVLPSTAPLDKIFSRNLNRFLKISNLIEEEYTAFISAYEFEKEELQRDEENSDDEDE